MLKPLGDRVVLKIEEKEEKVGGFVIAGNSHAATKTATVVAVGQGGTLTLLLSFWLMACIIKTTLSTRLCSPFNLCSLFGYVSRIVVTLLRLRAHRGTGCLLLPY